MIEERLQRAADALPSPNTDYLAIEEAFRRRAPRPAASKRRAIAIVLVALLLVGCVAGTAEYHLYDGTYSFWSMYLGLDQLAKAFGIEQAAAEKAAQGLGWDLPDTMGDLPFAYYSKYNLTTQEVPHFWAKLFPAYVYYGVRYATEERRTSVGTAYSLDITFGTMENEYWRRQFGYDENGVWTAGNYRLAGQEPVSVTELNWDGLTLYLGEFYYENSGITIQHLTWTDTERNVVFELHTNDESPDFLLSCAQELIS